MGSKADMLFGLDYKYDFILLFFSRLFKRLSFLMQFSSDSPLYA